FVHRESQAAAVAALGARSITIGDLQDGATLTRAAENVRAVYHICPNVDPAEAAIGRAAIDAVLKAGVRRFGFHSVLHPQIEAMPHHWEKARVEEMLFASGLDFTILQPAAYMQNIRIGADGVHRVPYPVTTRLSLVDLEDVARVAAKVLTEPGHSN